MLHWGRSLAAAFAGGSGDFAGDAAVTSGLPAGPAFKFNIFKPAGRRASARPRVRRAVFVLKISLCNVCNVCNVCNLCR